LHLRANISDHNVTNDTSPMPGRPIWGGELPARLPAWSVFWSIGAT
jgi:maltooligosyltrehalose trehalohydrolase